MHFFVVIFPLAGAACISVDSTRQRLLNQPIFFPKKTKNGKNQPKWQKIRVHHTILKILMILDSPHIEDIKYTKFKNGVQFWIHCETRTQCIVRELF